MCKDPCYGTVLTSENTKTAGTGAIRVICSHRTPIHRQRVNNFPRDMVRPWTRLCFFNERKKMLQEPRNRREHAEPILLAAGSQVSHREAL